MGCFSTPDSYERVYLFFDTYPLFSVHVQPPRPSRPAKPDGHEILIKPLSLWPEYSTDVLPILLEKGGCS